MDGAQQSGQQRTGRSRVARKEAGGRWGQGGVSGRASERAGYYHRQGNGGGIVKDKASVVVRAEESAGRRCV